MPLRDLDCKNAKGREKPYKKSDSHGLYLYVTPNGCRSFRWDTRFQGKGLTITLGQYPELSLKDAQAERAALDKVRRRGTDPRKARLLAKMAQADAEAATFEAIARQWHEKVRGRWNADHVVKILAGLEREIFPHIGQLPISQIKPQMVLAALKPILDRNAVDRAHRTLRFVCSVFEHGMDYAKRTSFNHPLIIMVGFATAWLAVTGFWLSVPHNVAA